MDPEYKCEKGIYTRGTAGQNFAAFITNLGLDEKTSTVSLLRGGKRYAFFFSLGHEAEKFLHPKFQSYKAMEREEKIIYSAKGILQMCLIFFYHGQLQNCFNGMVFDFVDVVLPTRGGERSLVLYTDFWSGIHITLNRTHRPLVLLVSSREHIVALIFVPQRNRPIDCILIEYHGGHDFFMASDQMKQIMERMNFVPRVIIPRYNQLGPTCSNVTMHISVDVLIQLSMNTSVNDIVYIKPDLVVQFPSRFAPVMDYLNRASKNFSESTQIDILLYKLEKEPGYPDFAKNLCKLLDAGFRHRPTAEQNVQKRNLSDAPFPLDIRNLLPDEMIDMHDHARLRIKLNDESRLTLFVKNLSAMMDTSNLNKRSYSRELALLLLVQKFRVPGKSIVVVREKPFDERDRDTAFWLRFLSGAENPPNQPFLIVFMLWDDRLTAYVWKYTKGKDEQDILLCSDNLELIEEEDFNMLNNRAQLMHPRRNREHHQLYNPIFDVAEMLVIDPGFRRFLDFANGVSENVEKELLSARIPPAIDTVDIQTFVAYVRA